MQRSNTYIVIFSAILTIVLGGLLSGTSVVLKPLQDKQVELDTKKKILSAVMDISSIKDPNAILELYSKRVKSKVVDINGDDLEKDAKGNPLIAEKIDFQKNHKINPKERPFPVFMVMNESDNSQVDYYILPMFGAGLWNWISGFVALEADLNTVKGVSFDHAQETPGLGARIRDAEVSGRYVGKKIFDGSGTLQSVSMVKGEKGLPLDDHHVDGMSGATLTGNGVNAMLLNYFSDYSTFISKTQAASKEVAAVETVEEAEVEETTEASEE